MLDESFEKMVITFVNKATRKELVVDKPFARYLMGLLAIHWRDGIILRGSYSLEETAKFIEYCLCKLTDHTDPTLIIIKLTFFFKNCELIHFDAVQSQQEHISKNKLSILIEDILSLTVSRERNLFERLTKKIIIFCLISSDIGSTNDSELLDHTKNAVKSVVAKEEINNFCGRNRSNRIEYLHQISSIVSGILIFNKHAYQCGTKNIRDLLREINSIQKTIKELLDTLLTNNGKIIESGAASIEKHIKIDLDAQKVFYSFSKIEDYDELARFNRSLILRSQYEAFLMKLSDIFEESTNQVKSIIDEFDVVLAKINKVVKYRVAVDSALVYPNFIELSKLWHILLYRYHHLNEINKSIEKMNVYMRDEMFSDAGLNIEEDGEDPIVLGVPFPSAVKAKQVIPIKRNLPRVYCSLNFALTNGLLVPSLKILLPFEYKDLSFTFQSKESSNYAEKHSEDFYNLFYSSIMQNIDFILLFGIEETVFKIYRYAKKDDKAIESHKKKTKNRGCQTETGFVPSPPIEETKNKILPFSKEPWNIWDFHRRAIQLANIRKCLTHSTLSQVTYGYTNALIQTYNKNQNSLECILEMDDEQANKK